MTINQQDNQRTELETLINHMIEHFPIEREVPHQDSANTLMKHFAHLFIILADGNEIEQLEVYLSKLTNLSLPQTEHQQALRYYQGVLAREKHEYTLAENILLSLRSEAAITPWLRASVANALGILYDLCSRFDVALKSYQECATIYRQVGDQRGEGKALKNQGIVLLELGHYSQANTQFMQAQALFQQVQDPVLECRVFLELGYTNRALGNWGAALRHYQHGLTIAQALADDDMCVRFTDNLGSIYCFTGMWQQAEVHYQSALTLLLRLSGNKQRELADIYHNLGFLALAQQQYTQAQTYYEQALAYALQVRELTTMSELYYRLGHLWQLQEEVEQAYCAYAKGIEIVEEMLGQVSQEAVRIGVMGVRQHLYQAMVLCCLELERVGEAFFYVQRAKSRAFLDLLSRADDQTITYAHHPLSTDLIQARMADGTAVIEFFATGDAGASTEMLENLPPETQFLRTYLIPAERLFAFVIAPTTLDVITLDITPRQLEARYFQRHNGRLRGTDARSGQPLSSLPWWHQLDELVIAPIRPRLRSYHHLFLAPHGALHYLPLHALSTTGQFTAEAAVTTSYIPSASILLQGKLVRPEVGDSRTYRILAPNTALTIGVNLDGLTHAEAEAQRIAHLLQGTALLNTKASVAQVCHQLPAARVIHFSCHGLFHEHRPMASALWLADGLLSAADILQAVHLQAELVTLSACDTGLNHLTHGDELMGFTRAFLGAGAQTILMTLWQVMELPTRLFMEHFYTTWLAGATPAAALQTAQHYLRALDVASLQHKLAEYGLSVTASESHLRQCKQMNPGKNPFDHPYYWGGFILVGAAY